MQLLALVWPIGHKDEYQRLYAFSMEELSSIESIWEDLGERVKNLREHEGLSQGKLAMMVDIDRTYLIDIEMGRRNVSIESLIKLSRGLDITLSELLFNIDPSNPDQGAEYAFGRIPGR